MPVVRTYGPRKVGTEALPNARLTSAETPTSEGAGLAEAQAERSRAIAGVAGLGVRVGLSEYARIQEEERQKADEVALLAADVKLAQWENSRLYDPNKGALTVKGQAAQPLPEQINGEYQEVSSEIASGLTTDRQRAAFARMSANRQINVDGTVRRHVFQEMQTWRQQELGALVENAHSTAVANAMDPRRVGVEMQRGVDAITTNAPRLGLGPEQVQLQVDKFRSATHTGVIDRLLAANQTKAAQVYFEETKGQIDGDAMARIEKALEQGSIRAEAQKQTDEILRGGGTLTEQRERAKGIDDPQIRDEVTQRLEHEATVRDHAQLEDERATLTRAYNIVDRSKDVTAIPLDVWTKLPGTARHALRSYADSLARGVAVETDDPTYYRLMMQARDDPAGFAQENLLSYKAKLDDGAFKQLTNLQLALGPNGDRNKAEKDLAGFRTKTQIVDDTLNQFGIDPKVAENKPTSPEGKAIAQLRRMLDRRIEAAQETGKKVTNVEIQDTLDGLLSQTEKVPGSWWNIWPGGKSFFDTEKRLIDLTITDVPQADRAQIESALRRNHRVVTDANILDLYLEARIRRGGTR